MDGYGPRMRRSGPSARLSLTVAFLAVACGPNEPTTPLPPSTTAPLPATSAAPSPTTTTTTTITTTMPPATTTIVYADGEPGSCLILEEKFCRTER